MSDPPPRRPPEWAARAGRLFAAAARPWVIALAVLGAACIAFPPELDTAEDYWSGTMAPGLYVSVLDLSWPSPRDLVFCQVFRDHPRSSTTGWMAVDWDRSGVVKWTFGSERPAANFPPLTRPPGVTVDGVGFRVSLWWLLGPPAAWSAIAAWRAVRTEPRPPSTGRRLARPWAAAFALVGAALAASGFEIRHAAGPNRTTFEARAARTPAGSWHPREVSLAVVTRSGPAAAGASAISARGLDIGFWWLVAAAVAGNLFTLARYRRPGSPVAAGAGRDR